MYTKLPKTHSPFGVYKLYLHTSSRYFKYKTIDITYKTKRINVNLTYISIIGANPLTKNKAMKCNYIYTNHKRPEFKKETLQ